MPLWAKVKRTFNKNNNQKEQKNTHAKMENVSYLEPPANHKGAFLCTCFSKASMTLEAAVIFPLMAAFLVGILFFFRIMMTETEVYQALNYTTRYIAATTDENTRNAELFAKAEIKFLSELRDSKYAKDYVYGGILGCGLSCADSMSANKEYVDMKVSYFIKPPVTLIVNDWFIVKQECVCRRWIGRDYEDRNPDPYVYITDTGTVYHLTENCTHLDLSVRSVRSATLSGLRNSSGGRYRACPVCNPDGDQEEVYITSYGSCYHKDINCSGLRRTIQRVRLSEVEGRRCCSRCRNRQE